MPSANPRLAPTVIPLLAQLSSEPGYLVTHWFWVEDRGEMWKFVPDDVTTADGVEVIDSGSGTNGRFKRIAPAPAGTYRVRGAVPTNVADLTAFNVSNDDFDYVAGDRALLVAQTTTSQNGPYIVGTVSGGVAALTRPADWATGSTIPRGAVFLVNHGTQFGNTEWVVGATTAGVVGTANPGLFPRMQRFEVVLAAGTVTIGAGGGAEPLYVRSGASVQITPRTLAGVVTTAHFVPSTVTAGAIGTAAITIQAQTSAGALVATDTSTLDVLVTNR